MVVVGGLVVRRDMVVFPVPSVGGPKNILYGLIFGRCRGGGRGGVRGVRGVVGRRVVGVGGRQVGDAKLW